MNTKRTGILSAIKSAVTDFLEDECMMMAAALAYYTAFSLPPLLVLIVTVAGWIWSPEEVTGQVEQQVTSVIGAGGWQQVHQMMESAGQTGSGWAAIVGIVMLLFGATGVMAQLQASLNKAWEVQPDPEQGGIKNFALKRLLSLGMILTVAFLLLVSLVLTTVLQVMANVFTGWLPAGIAGWVPLAINFTVSLIVFTLLFAAMLKWLPDAEVYWKDTWIGAAVTALLFMVGKFALGMYFSMSDTGQYGAAASFVLLLLWAYYSGIIFLLGAEFTQVWARRQGREIMPEPGAVRVVQEKKRIDTAQPDAAREPKTAPATAKKSAPPA